jgi:L-ascorbate metabolism protein UlaG (beta-lactamase superfamily)
MMASPLPPGSRLTWFGHSTFALRLPNGKRILFDPFLEGNPACPADSKDPGAVDLMLISHGHSDHFADALAVARRTNCTVAAIFEIVGHLAANGVPADKLQPMNKGGTVRLDDIGVSVTLTNAFHSNHIDGDSGAVIYAGEPAGFIVTLGDGFSLYFAGDTCVFGDMALIAELYRPRVAFLPIGDRFTMGPREAAKAVSLLSGVETVVPMHYATFPLLTGTPDGLKREMARIGATAEVLVLSPGETRTF